MGRSPCCDETGLKKGPWTPEEDQKLIDFINTNGHGSWRSLPKHAGLNRCGKSCRLRWTNYLRPDIKRGKFTEDEERTIINLHSVLGNKWSMIATHLPGRTDNEIKNYWNTHLRKKLLQMGIDPTTHKPRTDHLGHLVNLSQLLGAANYGPWGNALGLQADASQLARIQLLQNLLQVLNTSTLLNNGLLGNRNLNRFEGLVNGTSNFYNNDQPFLTGQEYVNPGLVPQAALGNSQVDIPTSWAGIQGGFNPEVLGVMSNSSSNISCENQTENPLPPLVSVSPGISQMESKTDPAQFSTQSPTSNFEAWEKLLDDETNDSYWKDILHLTSSSPSTMSW